MMNTLWLICVIINPITAFFTPTISLSSGRKINVDGKGVPVIFSPGLFGTMPSFMYSDFLKELKNNVTMITVNDLKPLTKKDIDAVADKLNVDQISYLSHSSFFPEVLESSHINQAILMDPINIPKIKMTGLENYEFDLKIPTYILKSEKLYQTDVPLPAWQDPTFKGDITEEMFMDVGHPDILNDFWSNVANDIGMWDTLSPTKSQFKDWKFEKKHNEVSTLRKAYRQDVAKKIIKFINNY